MDPLRWRLSVLMFLVYAVPGAWGPLFAYYLHKHLHFSPQETAWACCTSALGALTAPLLWGQVADRWLATQHCISLCSFAAAVLLFSLTFWTSPLAVFVTAWSFWFFMVPVFSLTTSLTFRHLSKPEKQFGPVRMWGTVGWVAGGVLLSCWLMEPDFLEVPRHWLRPDSPHSELADAFRLGAVLAFVLALFALLLPHTPPNPRPAFNLESQVQPAQADNPLATRARWYWTLFDAPLLAFRLCRQRPIAVFCFCMFGLYITMPFSGQMTPLVLDRLGVPEAWIASTLTIAQSLEILALAFLPVILLRLEEKGTLLLGIASWAAALAILTLGQPTWLVIASLGLHGLYITCFLVAGQVFVNRRAPKDIRASAQALLQFINGFGLLLGHLLAGWMRQVQEDDFSRAFAPAAILATALVVFFILGFRLRRD
ncbi:MAG: MFS transporter [Gemmataceae bacterium]|nr:MFS transporter [Gemmataceae bacterium]